MNWLYNLIHPSIFMGWKWVNLYFLRAWVAVEIGQNCKTRAVVEQTSRLALFTSTEWGNMPTAVFLFIAVFPINISTTASILARSVDCLPFVSLISITHTRSPVVCLLSFSVRVNVIFPVAIAVVCHWTLLSAFVKSVKKSVAVEILLLCEYV